MDPHPEILAEESAEGRSSEQALGASPFPGLEPKAISTPPMSGQVTAGTFTKNSLISVARLFVSAAVALILPAYLTHRLPVRTYSAWVLLLQMGAYVGYLDFGIQTGISKFVAEYDARGDVEGAGSRASAGLAMMTIACLVGMLLTVVLAWKVPYLFGEMPPPLVRGARLSLVFIGFSLSFGLLCSVPAAIFCGLQRYGIPMVLALVNRILYTLVVVAAVFFKFGLTVMGAGGGGGQCAHGLVAGRCLAARSLACAFDSPEP